MENVLMPTSADAKMTAAVFVFAFRQSFRAQQHGILEEFWMGGNKCKNGDEFATDQNGDGSHQARVQIEVYHLVLDQLETFSGGCPFPDA